MGTASGCFRSSAQRRPPPLHLRTAPQLHAPLIHSADDDVARVAFKTVVGTCTCPHAQWHTTCPLTVRGHIYTWSYATYTCMCSYCHRPQATRAARASCCTMRPCLAIEAVVDRLLHGHMLPYIHAAAYMDRHMPHICMRLQTWVVAPYATYTCSCIHGLSPHVPKPLQRLTQK